MMIELVSALALMSAPLADNPDGVVTTAREGVGTLPVAEQPIQTASPSSTVSSAAHGLTTEQQIDRWLGDRPVVDDAPVWREASQPRRMTGEVNLGIGSHDYSHASAQVTLPLGETGSLSLAYSQTKNGYMYRPYGVDGLFWSPRDEWLGPQWTTATGRSYSPLAAPSRLSPRDMRMNGDVEHGRSPHAHD